MTGFTPIRNGILEHLESGRISLLEFGVYVLLHLRADWSSGIYHGCALTLAYQSGDPDNRTQIKDTLLRLKRKRYINYSPLKGKKGAYEILIHKYEPRVGRLIGTRLNAWKHGELCKPEYEPLATDSPDSRLTVARESPEARPIQEVRSEEVKKETPAAAKSNGNPNLNDYSTDDLQVIVRSYQTRKETPPASVMSELARRTETNAQ